MNNYVNKNEEICHSLSEIAIRELHAYPRMFRSNLRDTIKTISRNKGFYFDRFSWPNAMLAISIENYINCISNDISCQKLFNGLKIYADNFIKYPMKINHLDNTQNGYVIIYLYEQTNNIKYKNTLFKLVNYLYESPKDDEGSLPYRRNGNIFVDSIGMICPFLCRFSQSFNDINAKNLAVLQIKNFINNGMDDESFLPYHGYNLNSCFKSGIIGWGRGVGWLLTGIIDSIIFINTKDEDYKYLSSLFNELLSVILPCQSKNGFFTWQLNNPSGHSDSSATAMILYAVKKGIKFGIVNTRYDENVKAGIEALLSCFDSKTGITNCSGECGGFGIYPQKYNSYPWSIAPSLSLLSLLNNS